MKKTILPIFIILIIVLSGLLINTTYQKKHLQKNIDEMFTSSYYEVILNLLNMEIEGISEDAMHMYQSKNTKHSYNLEQLFQHTSFVKNNNSDLKYIIPVIAQSSGYNAVTKINMDKELYDYLHQVPTDYFNNDELLKKAKDELEKALIK